MSNIFNNIPEDSSVGRELQYPLLYNEENSELRTEILNFRNRINPKFVPTSYNEFSMYEPSMDNPPTKVADYLYELSYEKDFDWSTGNFLSKKYFKSGACSGVRKGNFVGRNYDWYYNNACTFVLKTAATERRFASIGVAATIKMSDTFINSERNSEEYSLLPFITLDGINENGVVCTFNVVPVGDHPLTTGTNPGAEDLSAMAVTRFILDNAKSAKHAVELMKTRNIYGAHSTTMVEEFHWLIADKTDTFIVEIIDNQLSVIDTFVNDKPIMTNFYLTGWDGTRETHTPHAMGIERYNILSAGYNSVNSVETMAELMHSVNYTKAYDFDVDEPWYSEFYANYGEPYGDITINSTPEEIQPILDIVADRYEHRDRNVPNTWQTVHTAVYDITQGTMLLNVQEQDTAYEYSLDIKQNLTLDDYILEDYAEALSEGSEDNETLFYEVHVNLNKKLREATVHDLKPLSMNSVWEINHTNVTTTKTRNITTGEISYSRRREAWLGSHIIDPTTFELTFKEVIQKLYDSNMLLPNSDYVSIRRPIDPMWHNPMYIFGTIQTGFVYVDVVTGEVGIIE